MNVILKIENTYFKDLGTLLEKLASISTELTKKYPDIVVNAEVEVR